MTLRDELFEQCIEVEDRMGVCHYYVNDAVMNKMLELLEQKIINAVKHKDINPATGEDQAVTQHYLNGWMHCLGSDIQTIEEVFK